MKGTKKSRDNKTVLENFEEPGDSELFCISTAPSIVLKVNNSAEEDGSEETDNSHEGDDVEEKNENLEEEKEIDDENNTKDEQKTHLQQYSESKEKNLEKFLFGKVQPKIVKAESESDEDGETEPEDSTEDEDDSEEEEVHPGRKRPITASDDHQSKKRKPVWHDEDDDNYLVKDKTKEYKKAIGKHGQKETSTENYAQSLRKKFSALVDTPKWADLDYKNEDGDSDDEFFRETTDMLATGKRESLKKGLLDFRKLKDVNFETHNEGAVIRCCEFHPNATVGLVAGLSGTASLFQIDGKFNPKIQTVNFENFPIKTAHFTADGRKFLAGSQHFGHFYAYDMYAGKIMKVPWKEDRVETNMQKFEISPTNDLIAFHGKFGYIHVLSTKSLTKIFSLKMNDDVRAVVFSPDGEKLYSHGVGGEVYIWDLKAQDCIHRFQDDGCIRGTAIAISRNNRYLATGSDSGVVNIYNRGDLINSTRPKPEKIVLNLTTSVASVKFNPTSEILSMTSEATDNALKLMHLPSMSVFSNFPGQNLNLKRVNCIDFSLNGGYYSIGNNRGAANLFRLKHFGSF